MNRFFTTVPTFSFRSPRTIFHPAVICKTSFQLRAIPCPGIECLFAVLSGFDQFLEATRLIIFWAKLVIGSFLSITLSFVAFFDFTQVSCTASRARECVRACVLVCVCVCV